MLNSFVSLHVVVLQKEYEKTKSQRDMEEKYIVSAWYNMVREEYSRIFRM